jgi:hypothetical protein
MRCPVSTLPNQNEVAMRLMPTIALILTLASGIALGQSPGGAPSVAAPPSAAPAAPANPGLAQPGGATSSVQPRENRTGRNGPDQEYADCMRLWEPATHMTKEEWSRTCRRVQSRLDAVQIK